MRGGGRGGGGGEGEGMSVDAEEGTNGEFRSPQLRSRTRLGEFLIHSPLRVWHSGSALEEEATDGKYHIFLANNVSVC